MAIQFLAPNQVTTPGTGFYTLFYNTENGNVLSYKDSDCNIYPLDQLPGIDTTAIDECICDIIKSNSEKLSCAAAKGVITMSEFESWSENINLFSTVTLDPATGSYTHGITSTAVLFVQLTLNDVLCNGDSTGTASSVISGGTAPYTETWTDLSAVPVNPAALPAGAFRHTVTDANNVTKVTTFVIGEPPALGLTVNTVDETVAAANDGVASAVVTGGVTPYTYEWRDNVGTPIGQTTQTATGLAPATYQVIVTDANGCTIQDLAVVINPA